MSEAICVVLNNQHKVRVDEAIRRCRTSPDDRLIFQPYTDKHLRELRKLKDKEYLPVQIYFIVGQFGVEATAVGNLVDVEFRDEIPPSALPLLIPLLPETDEKIYAANLLYVARIRLLQSPLSLGHFRKRSNNEPLRPGRWTAAVCHALDEIALSQLGDDNLDGCPEEALEGHIRELFIQHRKREHRLRTAKIRAVLQNMGRLRCEVQACGFDFEEVYGEMGHDYAHVHHLVPLAEVEGARHTTLEHLAIDCPNCHSMIHRGGVCRSLDEISAAIQANRAAKVEPENR